MKRTRHIEITIYSRRVTVTQGGGVVAEPPSPLPTVEIITDVREVIASAIEDFNEGQLKANETAMVRMTRARPLHSLRNWFRKCF